MVGEVRLRRGRESARAALVERLFLTFAPHGTCVAFHKLLGRGHKVAVVALKVCGRRFFTFLQGG